FDLSLQLGGRLQRCGLNLLAHRATDRTCAPRYKHPIMVDLSLGSTIAGCRLDAVAGRGGMGVVYRATQLALGRPVALKAIAPELAEDDAFRERFQRESQIAASIDHPNVIPVYEAG